jgi:predicted lipoprotein with Yx(FWY)xxD motif
MLSLKRFSLPLFGLLLTVFVAACGTTASTTNTTTTGNATTQNTSAGNTMGYGNTSAKATPTMGAQNNANTMTKATPTVAAQNNMGNQNNNTMGNNAALIHTTQVMLNGKMVTVLTNAKGLVLYYKLDDPRPQSACTGACATDWPPVLVNNMNMMTVTSTMQLPHKLTIVKTANGNQVEYHGHPLYTYAGDMKPGVFTGRGMDKVWYLVSLAL